MDEVEQVKSKVDIVEIISEYIPLKKSGRNWKALCPFHGEKTPSFMVSQELQIYKCFGCAVGGDVFDFLERLEGMEFGEALRMLAGRVGVTLQSVVADTPTGRQKERLYQVNHLAEEFYHFLLTKHPLGKRAREYVAERGIKEEMVELFKLGFAPNLWDGIQRFMVGKRKATAEELEASGLVIRRSEQRSGERGFYDRFRGRLMFPVRDHRGNTIGFSARLVPGVTVGIAGRADGDEGPKYINTPETVVYRKGTILYGLDVTRGEIKKQDQAVLVEGQMDVISSYQAGVKNVVGVGGTALTEDQVRLLRRLSLELVVALDADFAGDLAVRRGIEMADNAGFSIQVAKLRYGKDPDECARHDPRAWRDSVTGATPVYDFLMASALGRYGVDTAEGKRRIGRELIPIWAKISDPIMRASLTADLARLLKVAEAVVGAEVERTRVGQVGEGKGKGDERQEKKTRAARLEEYLLALGFQKDPAVLLAEDIHPLFTRSASRQVLEAFSARRELRVGDFQKELPAELRMFFGEVMLVDLGEVLTDEEKWKKELEKTKRELKRLAIKAETARLSEQIEEFERKGEERPLKEAQEKLASFLAELKQFEG